MKNLNAWYDELPDDRRFLFFLAFVAVPLAISMALYPPAGLIVGVTFAIARLWPWR
jgi:hypothetical protein